MILIKNITIVSQNQSRQIVKDGAILVDGDKIADLGPSKKLTRKYVKAKPKIIDGRGQVALPG